MQYLHTQAHTKVATATVHTEDNDQEDMKLSCV